MFLRRQCPLKVPPSDEALEWVRSSVGAARILGTSFLEGGCSHSNFKVIVAGSSATAVVLRRWLRASWQDDEPTYDVERELATLEALEAAGFPAPRVIAADPDGQYCGAPALLLSLVSGVQPTRAIARTPSFTRELASALGALHQISSPHIPAHEFYVDPQDFVPPAKSRNPELWQRAFAAARPRLSEPPVLVHRDYHPGNTLWTGAILSGIVDWTQASLGHPDVDAGHMRWNLLIDYAPEVSIAFKTRYREVAGRQLDPAWEVSTLVDLGDWAFTRSDLAKIEPELELALARA